MDKNMILAVVLSIAFLGVWFRYIAPKNPEVFPTAAKPQKQTAAQPSLPASGDLRSPAIPVAPAESVERSIESEVSRIVVDSRGAGLKHWWLKDKKGDIDLVNHPDAEAGNLLPAERFPLATFADVNFKEVRGAAGQSVWRATLPSGAELEKSFSFLEKQAGSDEPSYFLKLDLTFRNRARKPVELAELRVGWSGGLGTFESERKENHDLTRVLAYPNPEKDVEKFKSGRYPFTYRWCAVDNRYYLAAFLPTSGQFGTIVAEKSKTHPAQLDLVADAFVLAPGEERAFELQIYGGPKGYTHLKKLGLSLEHAVDFGYFGFLGKWALKALMGLFNWTGNFGWAIILLTIGLQVLVFPLTVKSYKSAAAMKKLQPKIQELQKRYKDDPTRMNQEMLTLYRESKTNPFGGCVPMVLQIPIFWAFFTMLRNAYELRGAPWILWIHDLSQKDPYFVLPVVMGAGMFLQQKLSGSVADPAQAKVLMFMPVIFTFFFLNFPSGLVLYWLTNSLLTINTQYWLLKRENAT